MALKIAVVTQYFWPETFLINDLVKCLADQGHSVEVFTGKPNYPDGKIFPGYEQSGYQKTSYYKSVVIHRAPLRPRGEGGAKNLLLNYLSFVLSGMLYFPWAARGRNFDVVFVYAPSPITSAIPAVLLKWFKCAKLAIWVQDLWPESLSATGFINSKKLLRAVGLMVRGIYACADNLLVQSEGFRKPVAQYARESKIIYYPNSYSGEVAALKAETQVPDLILSILDNSFCLVFAGNIGTAQAVSTIVEAAKKIRHIPDCKIILVGSGSMLGWVESEIEKNGLDNLIAAGRFPSGEMPQFFSRASGLLVTLAAEEIFEFTIPSKVQAYLAAGKPIVASLNGEGARVVEEAGAGLTCAAEDAEGLADCIVRLYKMSENERAILGGNGRGYFVDNFEMRKQSVRLIELLAQMKNETKKEEI